VSQLPGVTTTTTTTTLNQGSESFTAMSSTTTSTTATDAQQTGTDDSIGSNSLSITNGTSIAPLDVGSTPSVTPADDGVTWGLWVAIGAAICCCIMFLFAAVLLLRRRQRRRAVSMSHNPYELQTTSILSSATSSGDIVSQRQNIYANTPSLRDASSFGAPSAPPVQSNYVIVPGTLNANATAVTIPSVKTDYSAVRPLTMEYDAATSPL
jgi:hypothetical protein